MESSNHVWMLNVKQHSKLDFSSPRHAPCGQDFTSCFNNYIAREVGCTLADKEAGLDLTKCDTFGKIKLFEKTFNQFIEARQDNIKNITGCDIPCSFKQYEVIHHHTISNGKFALDIVLSVKDITVLEEVDTPICSS